MNQETKYPPLRVVKIIWDDFNSTTTSMASGLTDEDIRSYFAIGRPFNVGRGELDYMAKVLEVEILS